MMHLNNPAGISWCFSTVLLLKNPITLWNDSHATARACHGTRRAPGSFTIGPACLEYLWTTILRLIYCNPHFITCMPVIFPFANYLSRPTSPVTLLSRHASANLESFSSVTNLDSHSLHLWTYLLKRISLVNTSLHDRIEAYHHHRSLCPVRGHGPAATLHLEGTTSE